MHCLYVYIGLRRKYSHITLKSYAEEKRYLDKPTRGHSNQLADQPTRRNIRLQILSK